VSGKLKSAIEGLVNTTSIRLVPLVQERKHEGLVQQPEFTMVKDRKNMDHNL
jgi:hypothetical protein